MYKFKICSSTICSCRINPEQGGKFLFITCNNNNLFAYNIQHPGIWAYNLSKNRWSEEINLINNLLPSPKDKIIGFVKEDDFIKIFSINKKTGVPKTRLHICDLATKEVTEQTLNGFLPDTARFCQMNIFYYDNCYYTIVCPKLSANHDLLKVDIYRLNLDTYTWECVYKSRTSSTVDPTVYSAIGIIYSDKKMYLFSSVYLRLVWIFNLETNSWSSSITRSDNSDSSDDFDEDDYDYLPSYNDDSDPPNIFEEIDIQDKNQPEEPEDVPPLGKDAYSMSKYLDWDTDDTCLIVSGNEDSNDINKSPMGIWKLNLSTLKWKLIDKFGDITCKFHFQRWAGITPNGKLVICDGTMEKQNGYIHTYCEKIYTTWTRFPKLVDIGWDAVLHYYPDLPYRSEEDVEDNFRIPFNFLRSRIK